MNADGTVKLQTFVNGSQKCMIQASTYGNLDLVTTAALHLNVGTLTVQNTEGSGYYTGAGGGGSPTNTDNVAATNWNGTQNVILHFYKGLYIGYHLENK